MTASAIEQALHHSDGPAIISYLVGGFPTLSDFAQELIAVSQKADVVEVGIPFTDPLADGLTIQKASSVALANGGNLDAILTTLSEIRSQLDAPVVLMSYLNPLLRPGLAHTIASAHAAGVSGFIVPDLPYEASGPFRALVDAHDLALIPLITPVTPLERVHQLCADARGFVYAVTRTGVTGGGTQLTESAYQVLAQARRSASVPVMAGFGVRTRQQVRQLSPYADGVIVGSALIECMTQQQSLPQFIDGLRVHPEPLGERR